MHRAIALACCLALGLATADASNHREQRGILDEAEKVLSMLNSRLDSFQSSAREDLSRLRPWAERVEQEVGPHIERVGDAVEDAFDVVVDNLSPVFNRGGGVIERNDEEETEVGGLPTNVPLADILNRFAGEPIDPFRIFGVSRRNWWDGKNVCVDRKVIDETEVGGEDDSSSQTKNTMLGSMFMDMTMTSCRDGVNFRECTTRANTNGRKKTVVVTHACCHGFGRAAGEIGCQKVEVKSVEETLEDLEGGEFLQLLKSSGGGLDAILEEGNVTIFLPSDDAVEDFRHDLEQLNAVEQSGGESAGSVTYSIDDGLISRKKRSELTITETPSLDDIVRNHLVAGLVDAAQMHDESVLETLNAGSSLRINVYDTYPQKTVMANCAKVGSRDNFATGAVVHTLDKVIVPATKTLAEIIATDSQFQTLAEVLEAANLMEKLNEEGQMTLFAPTDAAFNRLDAETREKILAGNGCSQDILKNHLLPNVICSGVIETKARTVNELKKHMLFERDEEDNLTVDGVAVVITDVVGTNGVIHVVDEVIVPETARSVADALVASESNTLKELFDLAGLTEGADELANATIFAPSEKALKAMPKEFLEDLKKDPKRLRDFLMYHVAAPKTCKCDFEDGKLFPTGIEGKQLRMNVFGSAPVNLFDLRPRQIATVQCARLTKLDDEVCGGMIHTVEKVLLPPGGDAIEILKSGGQFEKFLKLIEVAGLEKSLTEDGPFTVLAPVDAAFDRLDEELSSEAFEDAETAKKIVERHVVADMLCCTGIPRHVPFFDMSGHRTRSGEVVSLRKSRAGHIYADRAEVTRCDMVADNGVVHSLDRVLVPEEFTKDGEVEEIQERTGSSSSFPLNIFKRIKLF